MTLRRRSVLQGAVSCALGGAATLIGSRTARGDIPRLVKIREKAQPRVAAKFTAQGLPYPTRRLYLRAFKREGELEMWAADEPDRPMLLVETYPICAASGQLGPKRKQGDEQVPEGFYKIHRYNAWSGYHMSLRVNYPNASDRVRGVRWNLGGAIMVHGDCVTIGCIPIQNRPIEEVFLATLDASRRGGARVPIHIFPTRMDTAGMQFLREHAGAGSERMRFWEELQPAYEFFQSHFLVPEMAIDERTGAYSLASPVPEPAMPIGTQVP